MEKMEILEEIRRAVMIQRNKNRKAEERGWWNKEYKEKKKKVRRILRVEKRKKRERERST